MPADSPCSKPRRIRVRTYNPQALRLGGVADLRQHPLKRMLDSGLKATINSDDPAYFGGYLVDNFVAVAEALGLGSADLATLARNSIEASFLEEPAKRAHLDRLDRASTAKL